MEKEIVVGLISLILVSSAHALPAVGLKTTTASAFAREDTISCVEYGIYNPADISTSDALVKLFATGDFGALYIPEEPTFVKLGTPSKEAVPKRICFNIPKTYEWCLIDRFLCMPTNPCPESEACAKSPGGAACEDCLAKLVWLKGDVIAQPFIPPPSPGMTGSAVAYSVASKLELIITYSPDWLPFYIHLAVIILLAAAIIGGLGYRARKPPEVRRKEKIEKLKRKIEKLEKKK
jgi:hypothetical protein